MAVFLSNAGGAWDNAKKHMRLDSTAGQARRPHRAAVTAIRGLPFKDTRPSLNILTADERISPYSAAGPAVSFSLRQSRPARRAEWVGQADADADAAGAVIVDQASPQPLKYWM